jgi:hypothetical protein
MKSFYERHGDIRAEPRLIVERHGNDESDQQLTE